MNTENVSNEAENPALNKGAVMPRFLAERQFAMCNLNIEYNGVLWTSFSTSDHIRDKEHIIKKAIFDLKEMGLNIKSSDVKYWDTRWNVPLY